MTQKVPANMTVEDLTDAEVVHKTGDETIAGAKTFTGLVSLTGGQAKFPATQVPSADANTLDDYEEGTWTPSVGGTATYTLQSGSYVKIGKAVFFSGALAVNVIGTGSTSEISGLPFDGLVAAAAPVTLFSGLAMNVVSMSALITVGAPLPVVRLYSQTVASAAQVQNAVLGNGATVYVSGHYFTN